MFCSYKKNIANPLAYHCFIKQSYSYKGLGACYISFMTDTIPRDFLFFFLNVYKCFFSVPYLATYIFLLFFEQRLGALIFPDMALKPLPCRILDET